MSSVVLGGSLSSFLDTLVGFLDFDDWYLILLWVSCCCRNFFHCHLEKPSCQCCQFHPVCKNSNSNVPVRFEKNLRKKKIDLVTKLRVIAGGPILLLDVYTVSSLKNAGCDSCVILRAISVLLIRRTPKRLKD